MKYSNIDFFEYFDIFEVTKNICDDIKQQERDLI